MNGTQPHITFLASSSNSGATALRISWQRAVQLPQPVLARVCSFSCASVFSPLVWIASMIAPLVTPTQPQTVALSGICAMSRPVSSTGGGNSRWRRRSDRSVPARSQSM